MANTDLFCNYKKCRKPLTTFAWVTSCSHAFCEEDGNRVFEQVKKCPSCESDLSKHYDVVKTNLNPSEEFKSMVLAGLRPDTVLDIASRAISFWSYQLSQDKLYHILVAKHARNREAEMASSYQTLMVKMRNDSEVENRKIEAMQDEIENKTCRIQELEERLGEKVRQIHNIQSKYESLRRNVVPSAACKDMCDDNPNVHYQVMDQESMLQFYPRRSRASAENNMERPTRMYERKVPSRMEVQQEPEFNFNPISSRDVSPY